MTTAATRGHFRWKTRAITMTTTLPGLDGVHKVLVRKARVYGYLAVHPREVVNVIVNDANDTSTWEVELGHLGEHRRWKITYWPVGMTLCDGFAGKGIPNKRNVKKMAEHLAREFDQLFIDLPKTALPEQVVAALREHPRYDDLKVRRRELLEKYGKATTVKE